MPTPHQTAAAFISHLKEQGEYDHLGEIVRELRDELERNHDITVISAAELPASERTDIERRLTDKWGEHRIVFAVDPALLSGMLVTFKDQLLDLSGRAALSDLAQTLK